MRDSFHIQIGEQAGRYHGKESLRATILLAYECAVLADETATVFRVSGPKDTPAICPLCVITPLVEVSP